MISRSRYSRRQALNVLLTSSTLSIFALHKLSLISLSFPSDELLKVAKRLTGIFANQLSARVVGKAYLDKNQEEDSLSFLISKLVLETRTVNLADLTSGPHAYQELIRRAIRRDFDTDNSVRISGWILSRTEARLCALATYV